MKTVDKVEGMSLVKDKRIPSVKVQRGMAIGTPEDFEARYDKLRQRRRPTEVSQPKLKELDNPSLSERMATLGIEEG